MTYEISRYYNNIIVRGYDVSGAERLNEDVSYFEVANPSDDNEVIRVAEYQASHR